ncbi:hypothetical protein [Parasitella parasitica]|uniref:Uncharacterized protein n=1 Tax=Parasitella parasitica TaxID=35722 RepID=A0A0B7NH50_9FUNG|nr:hypothetical protein [Parasitella parasitica]
MDFEDNQDLIRIKNATIHKMPILHYDGNNFRSSIRLIKDNSEYYNVHITDEAMLEHIVYELKDIDKITVMGPFTIEHWKNRLGTSCRTTHIQAQYLKINNGASFEYNPAPTVSLQFRLMVYLAQNLPDTSKVSTPFDAKTIDDTVRKVIVNIYPNDKKRHSVVGLRVARNKVRKTLREQSQRELEHIEQNNKDLINQLTNCQE